MRLDELEDQNLQLVEENVNLIDKVRLVRQAHWLLLLLLWP